MAGWSPTLDRITSEAHELHVGRVLRTIVVLPFFVIGFLIGLAWLVLRLFWSGAWVGFGEANTLKPKSGAPRGDE